MRKPVLFITYSRHHRCSKIILHCKANLILLWLFSHIHVALVSCPLKSCKKAVQLVKTAAIVPWKPEPALSSLNRKLRLTMSVCWTIHGRVSIGLLANFWEGKFYIGKRFNSRTFKLRSGMFFIEFYFSFGTYREFQMDFMKAFCQQNIKAFNTVSRIE